MSCYRKCIRPAPPPTNCVAKEWLSAKLILSCPPGYDGVVVTIPAGTFRSSVSQEDADEQALEFAEGQLACKMTVEFDRSVLWGFILGSVDVDRELVFDTIGCVLDDPIDALPDWELMGTEENLTPVPIYGFVGFDSAKEQPYDDTDFDALIDWAWWNLCPAVDFCDGPEIEGIPTSDVCIRLTRRWMCVLLDGFFYYGRVGDTLAQAGLDLWPVAVECTRISLCFDANARPVFAGEFAGNVIQVRRYVGGVPTTFTWSGQGPKLFFNGVIQRNDSLHDVVCYYVRLGVLRARFQRDNFGVEYTFPVLANWAPLAFVAKIDDGFDETVSYEMVAVVTEDRELVLLRTAPYPMWPVCNGDEAATGAQPVSGLYFNTAVPIGPYDDEASTDAAPEGGLYFDAVVNDGPYEDEAATDAAPEGGLYFNTVVADGPYEDEAATDAAPQSGEYALAVIEGGTYDDEATTEAEPIGGTYAAA